MTSSHTSGNTSGNTSIPSINNNHINTNPFIPFPTPLINNISTVHQNNNIIPSMPTIPTIPTIPIIPIIPTIPTIPVIPLQPQTITGGVQYIIHPSMPNTPMILVPNILMNINNTNTHINNNINKAPSNNAKIKAILSKKRNGSKPLTNQETKILEAAVKSARQQFIYWYQQQAITQSIPLSLINPIQLQQLQQLQLLRQQHQTIQPLTPKQIVAIQQQQQLQLQLQLQQQHILQLHAQRLQQQQHLLQQQIITNNIYNNNNNNNNLSESNCNYNQKDVRINSTQLNIDTYFALPKPMEFDKIFYNDVDDDDDDDDKEENDWIPLFFNDMNDVNKNNLCFNIELDGIGVLSYGDNDYNKSLKTETSKYKRDNMYKLLGVKDNTNECCEWLIRDLMRSQSEFKSNIKQKCNVIITDIKTINKSEHNNVNKIINQIKCKPNITRCLFHENIYNLYCANNQIVEISHVDILRANIELIDKCVGTDNSDTPCNTNGKKKHIDHITTLEFYNLCRCMEAHFNPCNDVETLKDYCKDNQDIFYQTALKLRNNPNYFTIPTLLNKKHVKKNNNKNKNKNININNVNVTNRIINISNLTINTQPPNQNNNQWQSFPAYINTPAIQFINPIHPINNNITYPILNTYIPPVAQQTNLKISNQNYFSPPPPTAKQKSQTKQIKIPNVTSWNVGGL